MTVRDKFHDIVKQALIRENWIITDDPLHLRYGGVDTFIDLAAELIAAEKDDLKVAIEIKSFLSDSTTYEFHAAVGQFINYRIILNELEPQRVLYLAVPVDVYNDFFLGRFAQTIIMQTNLKIMTYDTEKGNIKWIS